MALPKIPPMAGLDFYLTPTPSVSKAETGSIFVKEETK
jgi:hypothetical protein